MNKYLITIQLAVAQLDDVEARDQAMQLYGLFREMFDREFEEPTQKITMDVRRIDKWPD